MSVGSIYCPWWLRYVALVAVCTAPIACRGDDASGPDLEYTIPEVAAVELGTHAIARGDEVELEVAAVGPDVPHLDHVRVRLAAPLPGQHVQWRGAVAEEVVLSDDGRDGDRSAGDGIFTTRLLLRGDNVAVPALEIFVVVEAVSWVFPDSVHTTDLGNDGFFLAAAVVDPARMPRPIVQSADGARYTSHVVALEMKRETDAFPDGTLTPFAIARRYEDLFAHDPDFLITAQLHTRTLQGVPAAYYRAMSNEVEGLGLITFAYDPAEHPESERLGMKRLQGIVVLHSPPPAHVFHVLIHELAHRWMAYLPADLGLSTEGSHWLSAGLAREITGFRDQRYNDLELYLMGLLPADSVARVVGTDGLTMDEVIAAAGPRVPEWPDASHRFEAVLVIADDRLPSDEEMALYHFIALEFSSPVTVIEGTNSFAQATGGRGTLDMTIPEGAAR